MISYVISAGRSAKSLARVICSTDDERIADVCRLQGVEVLPRPAALAQDDSAVADVVRDVLLTLDQRDGDIPEMVALLQPTSPLVLPAHIDACVSALRGRSDADSAQTVTLVAHNAHAYNQRVIEDGLVSFRFLAERRLAYNKQRKPPHYTFGNVVVTRSKALLDGKDCFGDFSVPVIVPRMYAFDVDTAEDVDFATYLIQTGKVGGLSNPGQ
jgi:CMP-N-acetylneuraminic acid synthetase